MNLSPLSFRIKKYPKDRSKQQRLSTTDQITEERVEMDYIGNVDQDEVCQRPTLPIFFDSVQKNSDTEHRARSPKLLDTRLYLHNRRACYNGNWPVRCITPPAYLDPRLYTSRIHGERERNFSHSRARE